jgi:hypothetical protein
MEFASHIKEPALRQLYGHWEDSAMAGRVPTRADFDLLTLPVDVLPSIFILEPAADGRFLCRLAGTRLRSLLGLEASRRHVDELLPPAEASQAAKLFSRILEDEGPAYFSLPVHESDPARTASGISPGGCLILPVATRPGRADQLVGALLVETGLIPMLGGWLKVLKDLQAVAWAA